MIKIYTSAKEVVNDRIQLKVTNIYFICILACVENATRPR